MTHQKPTKEELEANIKKAQEDLDTPEPSTPDPSEPDPSEPEPSTPDPSEPDPSEGDDDVDPSTPEPSQGDEGDDDNDDPDPSEPAPSPDYKKKFRESSREAQIRAAREKRMQEAIDKANDLPDPTEEELQAEYDDWEDMTSTEQKLAKENFINKRFRQELVQVRKEDKDIEAWNTKVDEFIDDPKTLNDNPDLEGRQEDFKVFASKKTRRNLDFDTLVSAFLYDATKTRTKKKGKMFPSGNGGPNDKGQKKNNKISIEEATNLRNTNYDKYKKLLREGKIETPKL